MAEYYIQGSAKVLVQTLPTNTVKIHIFVIKNLRDDSFEILSMKRFFLPNWTSFFFTVVLLLILRT